jgi:endonuclease YncB( thermonuclease family)
MQSKIRRKTVRVPARAPSRIRRDPPPRLPTEAELKAAELRKREREKWRTAGGLALFGAGIAAAAIAVGAVTYSSYDPEKAAAEAARFRQCYAGVGDNCVLDGDTIYVHREKVEIAGVEAPQIRGSACGDERGRGIDAAVRLADLLNSGEVTVSEPFLDNYGRSVRSVAVNGKDVGKTMLAVGVVRPYAGVKRDWCRKSG